jgi:hypothetical protein
MVDLETGDEPLRRRRDEPRKGVLVPIDEVFFRSLSLDGFLSVFRFFSQFEIFDDMLGRLRNHPALVIKTFAARPPGDLVKIPRT